MKCKGLTKLTSHIRKIIHKHGSESPQDEKAPQAAASCGRLAVMEEQLERLEAATARLETSVLPTPAHPQAGGQTLAEVLAQLAAITERIEKAASP